MADQTLLLLLDEVRGKTLHLLEGIPDRLARWAPSGLHNSILWHAGHSYILLEWFTAQALDEEPAAPEGWFEIFSWQSQPAEVPDHRWPPLAEVARQLQDQHQRIGRRLAELNEEELDAAVPGRLGHTARSLILHALHDEACHSGEIWLLRKMLTVRSSG